MRHPQHRRRESPAPTLAPAALLAILAAACTRVPVAPDQVERRTEHGNVEVTLLDGTTFQLRWARTSHAEICGLVSHCSGTSCARVKAAECTPKEDIRSFTAVEVDGLAVGVSVGAAAVIAGVAAAVVASNARRASAPATTPPPSSGAGSSANDWGGGSCPRAYSWDGETWRLDSGTYGLSHFEAAQRTDFDRLDYLAIDRGKLRLRLANEEDENEHTDLVRLRIVDHPAGTRVVPSATGTMHTFRHDAPPVVVRDFRGAEALALVSDKDGREWSSDPRGRDANVAADARDGLRLTFAKPRSASVAKLRIAAHNTEWAARMFGFLLAQRGPELPAWFAKMNGDAGARSELVAFLVREGMLNIRVRTLSGWSTRGMFWAAGREIVKEEAFEVPVGDVPGDTLDVELESALGFWSVDAASVDFESDEPTVVRTLSPSSARTSEGRDVAAALADVDAVRYDTVRGDAAELVFDAPAAAAPGSLRSFVLETTGYYVPDVTPAPGADPAAVDALMAIPFAASRLALALRLASAR